MRYLEDLEGYAKDLSNFITRHSLPAAWFLVPDHVAVKCSDGNDFEALLEDFKGISKHVSFIEMDGRRLATAELESGISVGKLGDVTWVEIMEPRPEKIGKDIVGFEHMEFFYPDFEAAREVLRGRNIPFEMQENPGHAWVNVVINGDGQELKLNNKLLGDTVRGEIETGQARILK